MGRDRADGRIELRGPAHRLRVSWDVPRNSRLYAEEQALAAAVVRVSGGRPYATPTWRLFRQPVTVHNLGGAPMGTDPDTGVVDADAEVFGHPGLYVVDGAILPGATGGNPSLTIAAVAERCIETAVRRITGNRDWAAPQRADVTPRAVPEDAAVRAIVVRGPRPAVPCGVQFRETMRGFEGRRRVVLRLGIRVPDLRAFLADPLHAARIDGTIEVEGLTGRPAAVTGGTLHLLAAVDGGPARTMQYLVPFAAADGTPWLLRGSKHVWRHRGTDPWRATTRLDVAITSPEDRYEGTVPTGRLTISFRDAVRLVTTIRPTGTTAVLAGAATVLRFGAFFAGRVARGFLARGPMPERTL
ncbi:GMC family oxidoreductase [Dactylosporangium sp. CA-139066]|uniref:GMC family oxidoreductase n=1 Tax=Dactylosporangium sp. CA-139066 TaxID=3239930 RepID=UPI003D8DCF36